MVHINFERVDKVRTVKIVYMYPSNIIEWYGLSPHVKMVTPKKSALTLYIIQNENATIYKVTANCYNASITNSKLPSNLKRV